MPEKQQEFSDKLNHPGVLKALAISDEYTAIVAIIGTRRGMRVGLLQAYAKDGHEVHATVRDPRAAQTARSVVGNINLHALDIRNAQQIEALDKTLPAAPNILTHDADTSASGVDAQTLRAIDVDAQIHVVRSLLPKLKVTREPRSCRAFWALAALKRGN